MEDLECCPVCYVVFGNCVSYETHYQYGRLLWLVHVHRGNVVFHRFSPQSLQVSSRNGDGSAAIDESLENAASSAGSSEDDDLPF